VDHPHNIIDFIFNFLCTRWNYENEVMSEEKEQENEKEKWMKRDEENERRRKKERENIGLKGNAFHYSVLRVHV
jgi:hypothetical protein